MRLLLLLPCFIGAFQLPGIPYSGGSSSVRQEDRTRRRNYGDPMIRDMTRSNLGQRRRQSASYLTSTSSLLPSVGGSRRRESKALKVAPRTSSSSSSSSSTVASLSVSSIQASVEELKRVLEREYAGFFDPMEREWYSEAVTFDDPLTSLSGVDAYQANVDMLASRTLLGKFLFDDAGIVLHSVTGGTVVEIAKTDDSAATSGGVGKEMPVLVIEDIVTRWTLRLTAKVLPWQPTARFSGISVYGVTPGGLKGVQIVRQTDYWDSINLVEDVTKGGGGGASSYRKVDKSVALKDFLGQLGPSNFVAPTAGPELPYSLLRRGDGYEVRRYPAFVAVEMNYERRDEGFLTLGSVTAGLEPLSPAILTVPESGAPKTMAWPVAYVGPRSSSDGASPEPPMALLRTIDEYGGAVRVTRYPEKVVAVGSFSDASVEAVVRRADRELRSRCRRDGLIPALDEQLNAAPSLLRFAQYDAVYTMGKRRGEVWVDLEEGTHPWSLQSR